MTETHEIDEMAGVPGEATNEQTGQTTPAGAPLPEIDQTDTSDLRELTIEQLREVADAIGADLTGATLKDDIVERVHAQRLNVRDAVAAEIDADLAQEAARPYLGETLDRLLLQHDIDPKSGLLRLFRLHDDRVAVAYRDQHGTPVGRHLPVTADERVLIAAELQEARL